MSTASSTLSVLRRVRRRLDDSAAWTKRAVARDANGNAVGSYHEHAVAWCLVGAVDIETAGTAKRRDVLALLDRAIAEASAAGA